MGIGGVSIDVC